jgi:CRP/FNR family cyclic AMP-dependent transcriptional regulator
MNDATPSLSGIELFDGLGGSDRDALVRLCRWHRYAAHQYIIGHQDETNDVYFIAGGRVRVTIFSPSGKEVSFADLPAGKSFGEMAAIDGAPRSATVIALSDTVLASMSAETFRRVLNDHPDVAAKMMQYLAGLVRKLSDRVVEFSVLAVRNRIHGELLRLARDQGLDGEMAVITPVPTHADIASRVSTHREAVTREMNALARDGLIERRDGALVIADVARLAQLVETGLQE